MPVIPATWEADIGGFFPAREKIGETQSQRKIWAW
jgi:hypothetical protein